MNKDQFEIVFSVIMGIVVIVVGIMMHRSARRLRKVIQEDRSMWRPNVVDPNAEKLSEQYGIAPERAKELLSQLDEVGFRWHNKITPLHEIISSIADLCRTKEEFAWASFVHAVYLIKKGITFK